MTSPNQTPDALRETVEKVHEKYQEDWNRAYDLNGHAVANGYPPPGGYPNLVDRILTALAPFLAPPLTPDASTTGKGEEWDEVETLKRALQRERQRADYALDALAACLAQVGGEIFIDDTTVHRLGLPRPDVYDQREEARNGRKLWVKLPAQSLPTPPPSQGAEGRTPRTDAALIGSMSFKDGHVLCVSADFARQLETELASARAELAEAKRDYLAACKTIADMHAAAVGEVRGPVRGVVEDVAALRAQVEELKAALEKRIKP